MKIAFVSQPFDVVLPPQQNSLGLWVYHVARRLARSHKVIVYTGQGRFRKQNQQWDDGVHYRRMVTGPDKRLLGLLERFWGRGQIRRPLFNSSLAYLGYSLQVATDLRKQQCDIVHILNFSQFVPVIRAFNPNIKIVLHMECEWLSQLDPAIIEPRLKKTDLVIGCSEHITRQTRQAFPQFAGRCQTVYNGVDVDNFMIGKDQINLERNGAKRLLFVGRVSPEKGVHVLLEAFEKVVNHYPEAVLEIAGPPGQLPLDYLMSLSDDKKVAELASFYNGASPRSYFDQLQQQARTLNIANQVNFAGFVPNSQLIDHYGHTDVLINPSFSEAFGISLVEAMACQVPVVATRVGGMVEIVEEDQTGLLVEPGDSSALAAALLRLLASEDLRKAMGEAGRKRAVERFSWERVTKNLLQHYQNIC